MHLPTFSHHHPQTKPQVQKPAVFIPLLLPQVWSKQNRSKNGSKVVHHGHGMAIAAAPRGASHGTGPCRRRDRRRRRRGRAGAGGGLQRRPDQPGGLPELRAGREHGGDAGEGVLLGAQGRGEEGGGLPLPGVPGRPGLRRLPQHDQGPAAARRVQGQDASIQQVPHFPSWRVSSTCAIFRGTILWGIAVVFLDTFRSITGRNGKRLHRSSSVTISFRCIRLPRFGKRPPSRSNCCCDPAPVSWAHLRFCPRDHF